MSEPGVDEPSNVRGGWLHGFVSALTADQVTPELTAADRCDGCGAQAYVRVLLPAGELLFCAHHARKHADALGQVATHIHDESDRLLEDKAAAPDLA